MLASVPTFAIEGVDAQRVLVEVDVRRGLPAFTVVGLPDAAVREARERVRAALLNSGFEFPLQRLTANLAPASLRKAGPSFDLALAVGVLAASGQVPVEALRHCAVSGELSLGGRLRPAPGGLAMAIGCRRAGVRRLVVAPETAGVAALVEGVDVLPIPDLTHLVEMLCGRWTPDPPQPSRSPADSEPPRADLADVRGQTDAKRALELSAAGGHSLLLVGPPGAGKTMMAQRLPGILAPPSIEEALDITRIRGVVEGSERGLARERPFRAPHHTISAQGLVGGGTRPRPGEITRAHRGVLFLDELAEFSRPALEALRQPLERGVVEITRGQSSARFPARTMLVAASNPCPCGPVGPECECRPPDRERYRARLGGPLIDRIDLVCHVPPVRGIGAAGEVGERSTVVRERVMAARERQAARLAGGRATCNGEMDGSGIKCWVRLDESAFEPLRMALERGSLTARGHDRVLRVARTIADLDGRERVGRGDVAEAIGYRLPPSRPSSR